MRKIAFSMVFLAAALALAAAAAAADWQADVRDALNARQYGKALALLDKNQGAAETPDYLCLRGEADFELGRVMTAAEELEKALATAPDRADCHATLALVQAKQRAGEAAKVHADRACELSPKPRSLYARAIVEMSAGKFDQAMADLDAAIKLDSTLSEPYLAKGAILRLQDKNAEAVAEFEKAMARDKRPYKVRLELATTKVVQNDMPGARAEITKAIAVAPEMYHGYLGSAFIHQQNKEMDAALADFTKAIELAPQLAEIHFAKANLLVGLQRYEEAEKTMLAAEPYCREIPDWYVMTSLVQGTLKKNEAAMATLNALIERTPARWEGYNLRGQLHASIQESEAAIADFDKATSLSPKELAPLLNKAALLAQLKKPEQALKALNKAIVLAPDNITALQMRMQLNEAMGRNAEALADLKKIEELKKKQQQQ
jgi:tetratricopeptide (TPR) repeat protein